MLNEELTRGNKWCSAAWALAMASQFLLAGFIMSVGIAVAAAGTYLYQWRAGEQAMLRYDGKTMLHMFDAAQLDGPPGLVGKPLKPAEGYRGEAVWYDALSVDPFVAKCGTPVRAEAPSRCLRAVHLAPGIAAIYAFDADVLDNWREFDPQVRGLLSRIGVFGAS